MTIELRIDSIAAGGDGVGRHNGMVVFVPRTAPVTLCACAPSNTIGSCADRWSHWCRNHHGA